MGKEDIEQHLLIQPRDRGRFALQINLEKRVFTPKETEWIIKKLKESSEKGFVVARKENNPSLMASFSGVEAKGISPKWNVKIYTHNRKKNGHSLVCVDLQVLQMLLEETYEGFSPPDLQLLRIDDAGWGFPLCGVMVGVSDETEVKTAVVPVEYFRNGGPHDFASGDYLRKYTELGFDLLDQFTATPQTHRVEICTGYINQPLRDELRKIGYDVRVVEIKGTLQDQLEKRFQAYVRQEVGVDIYYDPKGMNKPGIPREYRKTLAYGQKNCPHLIKTGWKSITG